MHSGTMFPFDDISFTADDLNGIEAAVPEADTCVSESPHQGPFPGQPEITPQGKTDQTGDAALLGKAVGVDEGKNTFVRLYGLEACEAMVLEQTELAIDALAAFRTQEVLTELARNMAVRNH